MTGGTLLPGWQQGSIGSLENKGQARLQNLLESLEMGSLSSGYRMQVMGRREKGRQERRVERKKRKAGI